MLFLIADPALVPVHLHGSACSPASAVQGVHLSGKAPAKVNHIATSHAIMTAVTYFETNQCKTSPMRAMTSQTVNELYAGLPPDLRAGVKPKSL
jgi:hypothetical protein